MSDNVIENVAETYVQLALEHETILTHFKDLETSENPLIWTFDLHDLCEECGSEEQLNIILDSELRPANGFEAEQLAYYTLQELEEL